MGKWMKRFGGLTFISPWVIGFLVFTAFPIFYSLYLSSCHWNLISTESTFIGLHNYREIFSEDQRFWNALAVTTIFTFVTVPLGIIGSLGVALLLNQNVPGMRVFRTIFFLPAVLSGVAYCYLWVNVFNPDFGILNVLLRPLYRYLGVSYDYLPRWIYGAKTALLSVVLMGLWGIGPGMITYLAGLKGISPSLYEVADIDGAGPLAKFRSITLPMLSPVTLFNMIMGIIGSFQVFTQGYVMTGGGPKDATLFYVLYVWQKAFQELQGGYASALAWILFLVILAFALLTLRLTRGFIYYGGE